MDWRTLSWISRSNKFWSCASVVLVCAASRGRGMNLCILSMMSTHHGAAAVESSWWCFQALNLDFHGENLRPNLYWLY
jgi:hypothetical protein